MKWFKEVFLQSIAAGLNINQSKWITEKQTEICLRYMKPDPFSPCDHFQIKVDNLWYFVSVQKKGYGKLSISDHL